MLLVRPFFMGFCLWLAAWVSAAPALAGVSCEGWNTSWFFQRAGAADISRCLNTGADPNARDEDGLTPLHYAATESETPAIVTALVRAGSNPNARDEKGRTPLHYAVLKSTTPAVVTALVKAGADLNARSKSGATPLHLAALENKTSVIVAALLDAGANPAARDKEGKTPWDHIKADSPLKGTDVYWRLNDGRFK